MTAAQGISKYGFRSWYERELILCHSYLVTGVLCFVLVMMLVEQMDWRGPWLMMLLTLGGIAVAGVLGGGAFQRYIQILGGVIALGEKCVCAQCRTYGVVNVLASGRIEHDPQPQWMRLQCRKCGHQWQVSSALP